MINSDCIIRYVYQDNQGVSVARNRGISESEGEYITFIDSDDWVSADFFEKGIYLIKKYKLDFILGQTRAVQNNASRNLNLNITDKNIKIYEDKALKEYENKVLSNGIVDDELLTNTFTSGPVCKIFKKNIIQDIFFRTDLIRGEDVVFNLEILRNCRRIGLTENTWYFYRQNESSVTKKYNPKVLQSTGDFIDTLYEMYCYKAEMIPYLQVRTIKQIYGALIIGPCSKRSPLSLNEKLLEIKDIFSKGNIDKIIHDSRRPDSFPSTSMDNLFFLLARKRMYFTFYVVLNAYRIIKNK